MELASDALEFKYGNYIKRGLDDTTDEADQMAPDFDELAEDRFIVGTPAEACADLERYERGFDGTHAFVWMRRPRFDHEDTCRSIELVGDEVIPNG